MRDEKPADLEGVGRRVRSAIPFPLLIAKPNAKVWRDLVGHEWRTKVEGTMDDQGRFNTSNHC